MATVITFNPNPKNMLELRRAFQQLRIQVPPSSYDQTRSPVSSDDITQGWRIGSGWIDTSGEKLIWECADNTAGAARWNRMVSVPSTDGGVAGTPRGFTLVTNAAGGYIPLGIGSNAQVLTADSAQTLGIKWATPTVGDVVGPGSATNNTLVLFDSTTGKLIKEASNWTIISGVLAMGGNINLNGTNRFFVRANANVFELTDATSAVNWLRIKNAVTGGPPILSAESDTDTNVSINFVPLGTGKTQDAGVVILTVDGTRPLTADWDNTGQRIRNTGVFEVSATEPATPVTGMGWLDTDATGTGGLGTLNYITITADLTLTGSHTVVFVDATAGPIFVTVPTPAASNAGRLYSIVKIDSTVNTVTMDGGFDAVLTVQDEAVPILSEGTDWRIPF